MSVGYLRKREQCKVMERMLEAERAKAARLREAARCHTCGKQATCVGAYEGREPAEFGCDDCCGHGNEDGWCEHFADDAAFDDTAPDAPQPEHTAPLSLRDMQARLPWTIPYSQAFTTSSEPHRNLTHDVLHVMKSLGRIAAMAEDFDHGRPPRMTVEQLAKEVADLPICALHIAKTNPLGVFDLHDAVVRHSEMRNETPGALSTPVEAIQDTPSAERAKAARLREALVKVEGDINWMLNEGRFLSPWTFEYIDKALADTAPDAPPVASELEAAHARIAELTEALEGLRHHDDSGPLAEFCDRAAALCGVASVAPALTSTTPRGIGPEAVAKVREALMEARDFCRNGGSSANSREVLARWVFTRLDAAIALLPESR